MQRYSFYWHRQVLGEAFLKTYARRTRASELTWMYLQRFLKRPPPIPASLAALPLCALQPAVYNPQTENRKPPRSAPKTQSSVPQPTQTISNYEAAY